MYTLLKRSRARARAHVPPDASLGVSRLAVSRAGRSALSGKRKVSVNCNHVRPRLTKPYARPMRNIIKRIAAESSDELETNIGPAEYPREFLPMPLVKVRGVSRHSRREEKGEGQQSARNWSRFRRCWIHLLGTWIASANNNIARFPKHRRRRDADRQALRRIDSSSAMNPWSPDAFRR